MDIQQYEIWLSKLNSDGTLPRALSGEDVVAALQSRWPTLHFSHRYGWGGLVCVHAFLGHVSIAVFDIWAGQRDWRVSVDGITVHAVVQDSLSAILAAFADIVNAQRQAWLRALPAELAGCGTAGG